MCAVTPGSVAANAGFVEGDRIIRAKGEAIDSVGKVSVSGWIRVGGCVSE